MSSVSGAYYNEFDPHAAAWLRELIKAGHLPPGEVDERSIEDVRPDDLRGFVQCHFFAGIGGWPLALRLAGVPDSARVWTGSCPCQPFSTAGKGSGFDDERHLWPAFQWLIQQCRPGRVYGEQVASGPAGPWLDLVQADMEAMGYAFGATAFPAAGVGAPHIRDRLYWVANAGRTRLEKRLGIAGVPVGQAGRNARQAAFGTDVRDTVGLGEPDDGRFVCAGLPAQRSFGGDQPGAAGHGEAGEQCATAAGRRARTESASTAASPTNGLWGAADWLLCRDGKWRPVEPGTFPLAHGIPARVVRLRGYGNAIVPQQAAEFIKAADEAWSMK